MRTLIINSMFFHPAYRRCADELGNIDDIELTMLTVDGWKMNGNGYTTSPVQVDSCYRTVIGNAGWKGLENRGFYRSGLIKAFQACKPEVIYLMEEPFSIFALEVVSLRNFLFPQTPIVFFTWNNLSYENFDYRPALWYRYVSRWTLDRMQSGLTANTDAIRVLNNAGYRMPLKSIGYGVDTTLFGKGSTEETKTIRERLQIPIDATVFGYVGRFIKMKGLDLLANSFADVVKKNPQKKFILFILGSGEYQQDFFSQSELLGVKKHIRHLPTVRQDEVPAFMRMIDVKILPSRRVGMWSEQFGRVLIEAMASRTVVIGSSSGAIPEVIGGQGFVFEENNCNDLTKKMEHVLTLDEFAKIQLLDKAERRAREEYSWKRFAGDSATALRDAFHLSKSK